MAQRTVKAPQTDPAEVAPASVYFEKDWFKYYDQRLKDLDEQSFFQLSKNPNLEAFRFFWLPEEGEPFIIRIDIDTKGVATLTSKQAAGYTGSVGSESWGKVKGETTRVLSKEELKDLQSFMC